MKFRLLLLLLCFSFGGPNMTQAKVSDQIKQLKKITRSNGEIFVSTTTIHDNKVLKPDYLIENPLQKSKVFHIGSMTKIFTSVAVMQLIESKKIRLNNRISEFFPQFAPNYPDVKISHLLNHSSGIPELFEISYMVFFQDLKVDQLLRVLRESKPKSKPGIKNSYSNGNYIILGALIEKITGKKYHDYIKQAIFTPLNLKNTFHCSKNKKRILPGYIYLSSFSVPAETKLSTKTAFAAGDLCSTSNDIAIFIDAIFSGKLLSKKTVKQMTDFSKSIPDKNRKNVRYGYGIFEYTYNNKKFYGHGGDFGSYRGMAAYNPKLKYSKCILANIDIPHNLLESLISVVPSDF